MSSSKKSSKIKNSKKNTNKTGVKEDIRKVPPVGSVEYGKGYYK